MSNKNLILALMMITSFIMPFMGASVNIALPQISAEFSIGALTMSWVTMSFLLSTAVFPVPFGKLADQYGRVRIFIIGSLILAAATLACALSTSIGLLITARFVQGLGGAMMFSTNTAIVTSAFPPQERGKAIGLNVTAVYLGLSAAPVLGGFLTQTFGWRSLFYIVLALALFVAITTKLVIRTDWKQEHPQPFDRKGTLLYILSMFAFVYGFSGLPDWTNIFLAFAGILGIIYFVSIEKSSSFPVLDVKLLFNNRLFAFSNLAALINYATTYAITFMLSLYLQYIKGLSPADTGIILVIQPILMAITASLSGRLSDKYSPGLIASTGLGVICLGLGLLLFLDAETSHAYLTVCLVILGTGFGLFSSPNTSAIMGSVEKKDLGIASAMVATMRNTGQMISMGIATLLIHIFIGQAKISPANYDRFMETLPITFSIFIALSLVGIWASLTRNGKRI
ncbi:MAG: MFS transporter [Bacteroidota bacterium]|nr:MFS transporter [Bacteroidota bacterium]